MEYYGLSEPDSWKLHMLFSPFVVPSNLGKEQIDFCISTYDKMHPEGCEGELTARLLELFRATKSPTIDETLRQSLSRTYRAKFNSNLKMKQEMTYVEHHMGVADSLLPWERRAYLRKHLPWFFD